MNKRKSRVLTYAALKQAGARSSQLRLFKRRFGEKVRITPALCYKHAADFDWYWAGDNLLYSQDAYELYYAAEERANAMYCRAFYRAQTSRDLREAREAYEKAHATAWANAYLSDT